MTTSDGERVALTAFVTYAVLAGGNAVGVRFSNRELAPLWGAGLRFALAAALLLAVMAVLRLAFPRGRDLVGSLLYGLFNFGGSFGLGYYALVQVHAGLGQILLALVPLVTLLLAVLWRQERLGAAAVIGTLLALTGVAVTSYAPLQNDVPLLSVLAMIGSAICFAQALVLVRRFPGIHPVTMNAVGMTAGAALLFAAALVADEPIEFPHRLETWVAIAYLVVIGSVVGIPALPCRSPVLGGITSILRVRDHPLRHPGTLCLARQRAGRCRTGGRRLAGHGRRLCRSAPPRPSHTSSGECQD